MTMLRLKLLLYDITLYAVALLKDTEDTTTSITITIT